MNCSGETTIVIQEVTKVLCKNENINSVNMNKISPRGKAVLQAPKKSISLGVGNIAQLLTFAQITAMRMAGDEAKREDEERKRAKDLLSKQQRKRAAKLRLIHPRTETAPYREPVASNGNYVSCA